jgi:L-fuculose-phosphate aldolase
VTTADEVVAAARRMAESGLVVGTAGNVSGRTDDGAICLTPSSVPYADITPEGLAVLDLDGEQVGGGGAPSTEKPMHLACYRAFPEIGGIVHCHPPHASMFAVAGRPIPAVIEEVILYLGGDVPIAEYRTTGTEELSAEMVRHLSDQSAVLMANHGLLCVGSSPADALHAAEVAEHTARIVLGADLLGGAVPLPDPLRSSFGDLYRTVRSGWPRPG